MEKMKGLNFCKERQNFYCFCVIGEGLFPLSNVV